MTPGPWKTGTRERGRFCVSSVHQGRGICVMSNTQKDRPDHEFNLIADANARLIAASPTLYSVLARAKNIVQQHNLLSTASDQERQETIARLIDWWNNEAILALRLADGE